MTDEEIINAIVKGGSARDQCIVAVHKNHIGYAFDKIHKHQFYGEEEKEKILHTYTEAVMIFQKNILEGKFKRKASCSTYLYRIFHNKFVDMVIAIKTIKAKMSYDLSEDIESNAPSFLDDFTLEETKMQVSAMLEELPKKCKSVLIDWNNGYSMIEIAERNDLKNEAAAKDKKYNCLKNLVEKVKDRKIELI